MDAQELQRLREIAHLIGSIYFYGGFKAETRNEVELQKRLEQAGCFYQSEDEVIQGGVEIDKTAKRAVSPAESIDKTAVFKAVDAGPDALLALIDAEVAKAREESYAAGRRNGARDERIASKAEAEEAAALAARQAPDLSTLLNDLYQVAREYGDSGLLQSSLKEVLDDAFLAQPLQQEGGKEDWAAGDTFEYTNESGEKVWQSGIHIPSANHYQAIVFYGATENECKVRRDRVLQSIVAPQPSDKLQQASTAQTWKCSRCGAATAESCDAVGCHGHEAGEEAASATDAGQDTFQSRVHPWMIACFGAEISADTIERNHRFLEEALELVQSTGCTKDEAYQLVDYVYGRPVGEKHQEVGGVMVTLAALCLAQGLDMHDCGEIELNRIWTKVEQIRAKQAAKPKHSPLPATPAQATPEGADADTEYKPEYKTLTDHRGRVIGVQWINAADAPRIQSARHMETEPFAWALPGVGFNYTFEQSRENPWKPDAGAIPLYRAAPPQQVDTSGLPG